MVHKCQAFTEHYLLNLHFAPVLCNSIYKMEKSSRELIRTRKKSQQIYCHKDSNTALSINFVICATKRNNFLYHNNFVDI